MASAQISAYSMAEHCKNVLERNKACGHTPSMQRVREIYSLARFVIASNESATMTITSEDMADL